MARSPELSLSNDTFFAILHPHWRRPDIEPLSRGWQLTFAVLGLLVFIGSCAGNLMVISLFIRFRSLRSFSNVFVLNLTVADFILCAANFPMFIIASFSGHWLFGVKGCQIYAFVGSVASFVSINTLAAIAVDRCTVIVRMFFLLNRAPRRIVYIVVVIIWIYSVSWATAPLIGWGSYILEGTDSSCTFDFLTRSINNRSYVMGIFLAHFVVPVSVITISYYLIFRAVQKQRRELALVTRSFGEEGIPSGILNQNRGIKIEFKTARISLIIIFVFCLSWFPYATVALIGLFGDKALVTRLGSGIPCICAKFATILNPLVYALLHPSFRKRLFSLRNRGKNSDLPSVVQSYTRQNLLLKSLS